MKVIFTLAVLAVGGLIAGCGSSSNSSQTTTSSSTASAAAGGAPNAARRAALTACLKQHGVSLPARPAGAGGGPPPGSGSSGGSGTGTTPRGGLFGGGGGRLANNPKLRAAFEACGARFGFGGGQRFRLSRTAITKYVTCVRQHGYNLPNPNFSGTGPVFPANIRTNAKFQAASRACQSLLAPSHPASTTSGA